MEGLVKRLIRIWKSASSCSGLQIEDRYHVLGAVLGSKINELGLDYELALKAVNRCLDEHIKSAESSCSNLRSAVLNSLSITLVAFVVSAAQGFLFDEALIEELGADRLALEAVVLVLLSGLVYLIAYWNMTVFAWILPLFELGMWTPMAKRMKSDVDYLLLLNAGFCTDDYQGPNFPQLTSCGDDYSRSSDALF